MNSIMLETSAAWALAVAVLGCVQARRLRTRAASWQAAAMFVAAAWTAAASAVLQQPSSALRAAVCLALLALALGTWPRVVSTLLTGRRQENVAASRVLHRTALLSPLAALVLAVWGVDWLTGIG